MTTTTITTTSRRGTHLAHEHEKSWFEVDVEQHGAEKKRGAVTDAVRSVEKPVLPRAKNQPAPPAQVRQVGRSIQIDPPP